MRIEVKRENAEIVTLNVGLSLMIAAADEVRESRRVAFEYAITQLGGVATLGEKAQAEIINTLREFLPTQIPLDPEVAAWLQSWEGRFFAVQHATKKTLKLDVSGAADLLDEISSADYLKITKAVDSLIYGEEEIAIRDSRIAVQIDLEETHLAIQEEKLNSLKIDLEAQKRETSEKRQSKQAE